MDKEELSLEQRIDDVVKYSKLIADDITNDYYIIPFMNLVIKVIDEKGFLTRQGLFIIHQDIMVIMNKLKEYPCDRDRIRAGLYFTICLNMGLVYISFVRGMEEEEGKKYKEYFTDDLIFVMNQVADRIEQANRGSRLETPEDFFYTMNGSDIDFSVDGILENNNDPFDTIVGKKYIIRNISAAGLPPTSGVSINANDIEVIFINSRNKTKSIINNIKLFICNNIIGAIQCKLNERISACRSIWIPYIYMG
jgi:hypothetical protein